MRDSSYPLQPKGGEKKSDVGWGCEKSTSKFQEVPPTPTLEMKNVEIKELAFHVRFHFLICVVSFMRRGSCKSGHRQYHNKKHNLKTEVSKSLEVNLLLLFSSQQVRKKNARQQGTTVYENDTKRSYCLLVGLVVKHRVRNYLARSIIQEIKFI